MAVGDGAFLRTLGLLALIALAPTASAATAETSVSVANVPPDVAEVGLVALPLNQSVLVWAEARDGNGGPDMQRATFELETLQGTRVVEGTARHAWEHSVRFEAFVPIEAAQMHSFTATVTDRGGANGSATWPSGDLEPLASQSTEDIDGGASGEGAPVRLVPAPAVPGLLAVAVVLVRRRA